MWTPPYLVTAIGVPKAAATAYENCAGGASMLLKICTRLEYWNGSSWQPLQTYLCGNNSGPNLSVSNTADCAQIYSLHGAVSLRGESENWSTEVAPPGGTQTSTNTSEKSRPCPGT